MVSQRRVRLLFIGTIAVVVCTLIYTSQLRQSQSQDSRTLQDFYHSTVDGLDRVRGGGGRSKGGGGQAVVGAKHGADGRRLDEPVRIDHDSDGDIDQDDAKLQKEMSDRLKAAEQKAKDLANAKAPNKPDAPEKVIGVGSSAGGQQKKGKDSAAGKLDAAETKEDHEIETTLNDILKRSPVIIFSKTYCQFSKRAKGLLLEKYAIDPEPYVVELDTHPLGQKIQAKLAKMTGRSTVPNIMVNGRSIGGSDDIADLDRSHALVEKITTLGSVGGKTVTMKERFVENKKKADIIS